MDGMARIPGATFLLPLRRASTTTSTRRRCDSDTLGAGVPSSYYEIRVSGTLPPEALLDFERLSASVEPVETVVHGPIQDQAALNGLLARLEEFGVQVLEIRRLHGGIRGPAKTSGDARGQEGAAGAKDHPWRVIAGFGSQPRPSRSAAEATSVNGAGNAAPAAASSRLRWRAIAACRPAGSVDWSSSSIPRSRRTTCGASAP